MNQAINPNDFIITRKRKLYKFAVFQTLSNCYDTATWQAQRATFLQNTTSLTVEVGAGSGLFLTELARRHPERTFVAVDRKSDRLYLGAKAALADNLTNIFYLWTEAKQLTDLFDLHSVDNLWITFPDPWPQESNIKHRLTNAARLKDYQALLKPTGQLEFKTDNAPLFSWSVPQFTAPWQVDYTTDDLHDAPEVSEAADARVMTSYEARYRAEGKPIHYLRAHLI